MSVFRVSLFRVSLAGQVDWRTELFVTRLHHYYEDFSNDDAWVFIFFFSVFTSQWCLHLFWR